MATRQQLERRYLNYQERFNIANATRSRLRMEMAAAEDEMRLAAEMLVDTEIQLEALEKEAEHGDMG